MEKAYLNWSGGKDAALALYYIQHKKEFKIDRLVTCIDTLLEEVSMHGVPVNLIKAQAASIGMEISTIQLPEMPDMAAYESIQRAALSSLSQQQFTHSIFGDIFLEDLRLYREQLLHDFEITAVFPLWKKNTSMLMSTFLKLGFKAIVVCVNEQLLGKEFCGRIIDAQFVKDLPQHVDVCGENGEYHSFVFDGPIFKTPVSFTKADLFYKEMKPPQNLSDSPDLNLDKPLKNYGFWFCKLY